MKSQNWRGTLSASGDAFVHRAIWEITAMENAYLKQIVAPPNVRFHKKTALYPLLIDTISFFLSAVDISPQIPGLFRPFNLPIFTQPQPQIIDTGCGTSGCHQAIPLPIHSACKGESCFNGPPIVYNPNNFYGPPGGGGGSNGPGGSSAQTSMNDHKDVIVNNNNNNNNNPGNLKESNTFLFQLQLVLRQTIWYLGGGCKGGSCGPSGMKKLFIFTNRKYFL